MTQNQRTDPANDCEILLDLIPEYAFGLIDPEQTRVVESGLASCPQAVAQLEEYRNLQAEMRAAVPQIEPSAQLGARLMAAIAAPVAVALPLPTPAAAPTRSGRLRRPLRIAWWVAAAAVLALVVTNVYWLTRITDLTQSQNLLTTLLNAQGGSAFVLTSTDALHWVRLADTQPQSDTAAFMMWNSQSKIGLLYAHNFPTLDAGKTYHLWLTNGDERVSVGELTINTNGDGALLFTSPMPIDHFTWAHISAEPDASSTPNPTAQPVVSGELNPT